MHPPELLRLLPQLQPSQPLDEPRPSEVRAEAVLQEPFPEPWELRPPREPPRLLQLRKPRLWQPFGELLALEAGLLLV